MKSRYLVAGCSITAAIFAGLFSLGVLRSQTVPVGEADPAFEYYSKGHSNRYAAIDHWAHYGMRAKHFVDVMGEAGYDCNQPTVLKEENGARAIRETLCNKTDQWPLRRTLTIHANIEHGVVARLVGARASSTLTPDDRFITKWLANLLRNFGWMEPETLQVAGFQIDSIETLTRMVADTLSSTGWYARCTEDSQFVAQCREMADARKRSGFPALPQGTLPTGTALELHRAMERISFLPIQKRGADNKPEDSLIVRPANGRMWLDFVSKDLGGRDLAASIELESKGGTPINLMIGFNGESKSIPLAGGPRRANNGSVIYLLPEAGPQDTRYSVWLSPPSKDFRGTFDRLAQNLPRVDPAFIPAMVKAIMDDSATDARPEDSLGLYPALRQMEQKAEVVRALHPDSWLPREQGNSLIAQAYPEDPVIRAAWAFATCESNSKPESIDGNCLLRFATADPHAAALVRSEIAKQQSLYADLLESHPIRIRLKHLNEAFSTAHHDKRDPAAR